MPPLLSAGKDFLQSWGFTMQTNWEGTSFVRSLEAEQALLAAILVNNKAYDAVGDFLRPHHFTDELHAKIYTNIVALINSGKAASLPSVCVKFDDEERCYAGILVQNAISIASAGDYGRILLSCWQQRRAIEMGSQIIAAANDWKFDQNIDNPIADTIEQIIKIYQSASNDNGDLLAMPSAVDLYQASLNADRGRILSTGIADLDKMIGGIAPGDLCTVAGATGMGKTAFALTLADNITKARGVVLYYSLEMTVTELLARFVAADTGIPQSRQRAQRFSPEEYKRMCDVSNGYRERFLFLHDKGEVTVERIRAHVRQVQRRQPVSCVMIDYLGLMTPPKAENRTNQVSQITAGLKRLAVGLDVPVILFSQVNRSLNARDDKRPQLHDLRDSGSIEQDSNLVLMLFREEYYLRDAAEPERFPKETEMSYNDRIADWHARKAAAKGKAEIIIAKNRHGQLGTVVTAFDGLRSRFGA